MRTLALPALVLGLAACGSRGTDVPACDVPFTVTSQAFHTCDQYGAATSNDAVLVTQACMEGMGVVVDACPSENLLGTCTRDAAGQPTRPTAQLFYSDGGTTAADAQIRCITTGGKWTGA